MNRRIQSLSLLLFGIDLTIVLLSLWLSSLLRSTVPMGIGGAISESATQVPWYIALFAVLVWGIGLVSTGTYDPQRALRWFSEGFRVVLGAGMATMLFAGALYLFFRELPRLQFFYFFVVATGLILGSRAVLRVYYRLIGRTRPGGSNRILILGAGDLGKRVAKVLLDHSRWGYHPVGFLDDDTSKHGSQLLGLPVLASIDHLQEIIRERTIHELWIALPAKALDRLGEVVSLVEELPVRIKVVPDYFSLALIRTNPEVLGNLPVIGLRDPLIEGVPRVLKRAFDLAASLLLFILMLPLLVIIAVLIRMDSKGPVLFRQERVGENGRDFMMIKFRTMSAEAESRQEDVVTRTEDGELIHKKPGDPRVTRVGRILRRFSLDELPQLINVIWGDMSLVGPRPEMPWLVEEYEAWQRKRFAVPQGITGWWQINGRSDKPMHLNTQDDLYYIYNYSLFLDIWILLQTPVAVLRGKGAF